MLIRDHLAHSGGWLFRWRQWLPLVFLPFLALALSAGEPVERFLGDGPGDVFELFALGLVLLGQALRVVTVGTVPHGTSGRNRRGQRAQSLNTTGAYSVCRNPLYLGNCMIYVGLALLAQSLMLALVMILVLSLYFERIISAEVAFLSDRFGDSYLEWAARTPAILPRVSGWCPPSLPFCWRAALRRENSSLFLVAMSLWLLELGESALAPGHERLEPASTVLFGVALALYLASVAARKLHPGFFATR